MSERLGLFLLFVAAIGIAFSIGSEHGGKKLLERVKASKSTVVKGFCKE
ncbi:MAG: hypothetical protein L0Y74_08895 [candidate division Zixibacteria bacterium]|nr:hypothetical protein [candidate division Zixibacteria bacterium]